MRYKKNDEMLNDSPSTYLSKEHLRSLEKSTQSSAHKKTEEFLKRHRNEAPAAEVSDIVTPSMSSEFSFY